MEMAFRKSQFVERSCITAVMIRLKRAATDASQGLGLQRKNGLGFLK